jgi:signal transduction histidine kinase
MLLPERLFTPAVFFVSLFWMMILHFLDWENNNGLNQPAQRSVAVLVAHLVAFAPPAIVYLGLRRRLKQPRLVQALFLAIVIAAPLRGFTFFHLLEWINGQDRAGVVHRMTGSLTNLTFAIVVAWVGFSAAEHHKRRKQRLIRDRHQLLAMRNQARSQLASLDRDSAEQIRSTLLDSIKGHSADGATGVASVLRGLIDDVVRPLSRYFEQQSDRWVPPDPPESLVRIDWKAVLANVLNPRNINPVLVIALMFWLSMVNTAVNRGLVIVLVSAVHFALTIPVFIFVKRLAISMAQGRGTGTRGAIFIAALLFSGEFLGLTAWFYTRYQEPHFFYATVGPIFVLIGGTLIAFARSLMTESAAMEDSLTMAASDLRWSLARAREQHRQQRRSLAHALHGQVQAALASAVLRLEIAHPEADGGEDVSGVVVDLVETISGVNMLVAAHEPVEVVIERIKANWMGIATITVNMDPRLPRILLDDQVCAVALNDVLTELAYNSIKHGAATSIWIDLAPEEGRLLRVAVTDNGQHLNPDSGRGLGSALLDDCAVTWRRSRDVGRTGTELLLPCPAV